MDVKNDVRQGLLSKEDTNSKLVNSPADLAGGIGPRSSGGGGWGEEGQSVEHGQLILFFAPISELFAFCFYFLSETKIFSLIIDIYTLSSCQVFIIALFHLYR